MDDTQQIDDTAVADPAAEEVVEVADDATADPAGEVDLEGTEVAAEDSAAEASDDSDEDSDDDDSDDDDSDDDSGDDDEALSPLDVEAEVAADYLEELLDIAELDGDLDTYVDGGRAHVSILTDSEVLVGPNGEVLDALQELARLAVLTETGERSRLMLDVAGYRERRRKELTDLATDAVTEVKETQERVALAAMNAFERKIVHDVVAAAGLVSESEGEEPNRHVVVLPSP